MEQETNKYLLPVSVVIAGLIIAGAVIYSAGNGGVSASGTSGVTLVDGGQILPLKVEEKMLKELVRNGTINADKLSRVTELNLLWAFGLANKNQVLESGPIMESRYGGPTNMASVGGWTVSTGAVMDHYAKHSLVKLTSTEQELVEKIAKGVYRPCCNNSTHLPDCNHGMAMLGLLEYLASTGATEQELWNAALTANMKWFPNQYQIISKYLKLKSIDATTLTPAALLGADYSSASGFAKIAAQVPDKGEGSGGAGCDVGDTGAPAAKQSTGCGI